jgi:hypothetical protein
MGREEKALLTVKYQLLHSVGVMELKHGQLMLKYSEKKSLESGLFSQSMSPQITDSL